MITLAEIVAALSGLQSGGNELPDVQIGDVTADSRRVAPGALFVAIRGDQHDGHAYLPAAIQAGAAAAVGTATTDELVVQGIVLPVLFRYRVDFDDAGRSRMFRRSIERAPVIHHVAMTRTFPVNDRMWT